MGPAIFIPTHFFLKKKKFQPSSIQVHPHTFLVLKKISSQFWLEIRSSQVPAIFIPTHFFLKKKFPAKFQPSSSPHIFGIEKNFQPVLAGNPFQPSSSYLHPNTFFLKKEISSQVPAKFIPTHFWY